jgi:hypothetical protein
MGRSSYLRSRGSSGTSYGPAGMGGSTYTPPNTSQVNPSNPQVKKSIDDRKTAYESMQQAGMLTPNLSGVSLYDQSPVIYEEGTTSQEILGADDPKDIGGQQVDLKGTMVDGLTPFYSTYADDAINTGNVAYKARMYALSKGASEDEAQLIADQANNELKKLVSEARNSGDYSAVDQFFAGENEFFQSILPQTLYESDVGVGGYTGSPTNYVGQDELGRFFDIDDPTPGILSNRSGFGGGGGGSYGGGGGDYAAGIAAGLGRRPKQLGDEESVPKGLRLLQYMVNLHKENPYTKMALRKKSGGIVSLVGG